MLRHPGAQQPGLKRLRGGALSGHDRRSIAVVRAERYPASLSHVPEWDVATWCAVPDLWKPHLAGFEEGQVLGIGARNRVLSLFFARYGMLVTLFVPWARDWRYLAVPELTDLFACFRSVRTTCRGLVAAFGRTERQRSLRHKLDVLLDPVVPDLWKYVVAGVAEK